MARVSVEIINYAAKPTATNGPVDLFLSVQGEVDENGDKSFREIVRGPSVKAALGAILDDIRNEKLPTPTHVHGQRIDGDLQGAIMAAQELWW